MKLSAQANYLRMSPRKVQLVTRLVAGLSIDEALAQLMHSPKLASTPIVKLVNSAVANTLSQLDVKKEDLFIKEISVGQGPTLKRYKPRAFGRAGKIRKRTSHVTVSLGIREEAGIDIEKVKKKVAAIDKPTNLEDLEKEATKLEEAEKKASEIKEGSAKKGETEKDANTSKATDKKEAAAKSVPQGQKQNAQAKPGSKGTDSKFMKKIFSRKVG